MASTPLGDIPGARFHEPIVATHAAIASGGANARLGQFGPFAHPIRMRNVWWTPTGADQAATQSASYRRLNLYVGGVSGTASASSMASIAMSASAASLAPVAMTVDTTVTLASGAVAYFSQATVGAAEANGTVLVAGQFSCAYEVV